jgi:predicted nucleic acid-binding protein
VILIDTGPMVALLRRPDQHHERCVSALRALKQPLGTVWPTVTEAMFLLGDRPDAQSALWDRFENEAIALLALDRQDVPRIRELMWKYRDRSMDFADAALVRVAERDGIDTVFTVDRADFQVYRLSGRRRFKIVP